MNKLAICWADDLSSSGKWQAWLAMEEHDGMDSVSVGDSHLSYSTNTESKSSSSSKSCSSSSSIKTVSLLDRLHTPSASTSHKELWVEIKNNR